jgi:hypothetical protein
MGIIHPSILYRSALEIMLGANTLRNCVFRQFPDTDFGNLRTAISVIPGQGFR